MPRHTKRQPGEFDQSLTRNLGKPCKHPGCPMPRYRVSSWCRAHDDSQRMYGHPDGTLILAGSHKAETKAVSEFIDHHLHHRGIQSALKWLQNWLDEAQRGDPSCVARQDMSRLAQQGVTPEDILKAVASIWLYSYRYPHRLPDDSRLDTAISLAVLKTAPRLLKVYPGGKAGAIRYTAEGRRMIGKRIRGVLGLLVMNLIETIQSLPDAREQLKADMSLPFDVSPTWVEKA